MKKRNIILYRALIIAMLIGFVSCGKFLDEMPDNRAEIDTESKVLALLVSAYPENHYALITEFASDNIDDYTESNPNYDRYYTQLYDWSDMTETGNESGKSLWNGCYSAISSANGALDAIEIMGANTPTLRAAKGEALMCRAFNHFVLATVFCHSYDPNFPDDLGVPYMDASETELNPKYDRGTLAATYAKIDADIQEGLPLVNDAIYKVPKYHFNVNAAYAFAARFYLNYHQPTKVIEYTSKILGNSPQSVMRDRKAINAIPIDNVEARGLAYVSVSSKANYLLLAPVFRSLPFVNYSVAGRYTHGAIVANTETIAAKAPWGGNYTSSTYFQRPSTYASPNALDKMMWVHSCSLFEMKDPVAQTGYYRTVFSELSSNGALLDRIEASILEKDYSSAIADMNIWISTWINVAPNKVLTTDIVNAWAESMDYYTDERPTPKKKLNAPVAIETGTQENMLHALLFFRRLETLYTGQRWFDVKRYGIEIVRRRVPMGQFDKVTDRLLVRDPRRAIQLPQDVISAGLVANPR